MFVFDHAGITVTMPQPGENWVEQSRVWVTNPREHPDRGLRKTQNGQTANWRDWTGVVRRNPLRNDRGCAQP